MVKFIKFFFCPFLDLGLVIYDHPLSSLFVLLGFISTSILILCQQKKLSFGATRSMVKFMGIIIGTASSIFLFTYCLVVYSTYIEPNWIKVERVTIKNTALSNAFEGVTAVQITDLHIRGFGYRERQMIKILNKLKPDIIFITGDFIDQPKNFESCLRLLENINPVEYGIWGVTGDRDIECIDSLTLKEAMKKINITILTNEVRKLNLGDNPPFRLIGINGDNIEDVPSKFLSKSQLPTILLSHHPEVLVSASSAGIDLVLSGDTHGGQVGPKFLRELWRRLRGLETTEPISGLYKMKDTQLYVSRGIGLASYPPFIRFFCRPEITVFNLKSASSPDTN